MRANCKGGKGMPDVEQEQRQLEALTEALRLQWDSKPIKSEQPDFLAQLGGRTIGVELTEFHLPPDGQCSHQAKAVRRAQIVAMAMGRYAESSGLPVDVVVCFQDGVDFHHREIGPSAARLAAAVQGVYLYSCRWVSVLSPLPAKVLSARVRSAVSRRGRWRSSEFHYEGEVTSEMIQTVLEKKVKSLQTAKQKCEEAWLAIVADEWGRSAPFRMTDEALQACYASCADRIMWLDPWAPEVIELKRFSLE